MSGAVTFPGATATAASAATPADLSQSVTFPGATATATSQTAPGAISRAFTIPTPEARSDDVFTVTGGWGAVWEAAVGEADTRQVVIVGWGDSITQGAYSSHYHNKSFFGQTIETLQALYGDGGSGFHSVRNCTGVGATGATYITKTGAWTTFAQGINESLLMNNTAGLGTVVFPGVRGSTIDVWVGRDDVLAMSFDIDIDGGGYTTQAVVTGADAMVKFSFSTTPGTHTVTIRPTAAKFVQIYGVSGMNPTGVVGHNMGQAGRTSAAGAVTTGLASGNSGTVSVTDFDPDVVILEIGVNDFAFAVPTATYETNMERLSDLAAGAELVYVITHRGSLTDTSNVYPDYQTVVLDVSTAYTGAVYDAWVDGERKWSVWNTLGYWGITNSATGNAGTDPVHPSDAGHSHMGDQVFSLLEVTEDATATPDTLFFGLTLLDPEISLGSTATPDALPISVEIPQAEAISPDATARPDPILVWTSFPAANAHGPRIPGARKNVPRRYISRSVAFDIPVEFTVRVQTGYDWSFEEEELALLLTVGV
jgi:lysophospholipase L1-like esterase